MRRPEVTLIDYTLGNLLSVRRALEHCGAHVTVSSDPDTILSAPRIVLPGVGAFAVGMQALRCHNLDVIVREAAVRGTPLLGICLGMQMLFDESSEFVATAGLGLIPGRVVPIPRYAADGVPLKIPHIGWTPLALPKTISSWQRTLLADVKPGEAVYFVHSYMADPVDSEHRIADCLYSGLPISAVVSRENIWGSQFHPEKSGVTGLKILRQFLML